MLFYTTLFIVSLLVTLVILWLYNLVVFVGKKINVSRSSGEYSDGAHQFGDRKYAKIPKMTTQVWGSSGHATPAGLACTHPARPNSPAPWGWPGHDHEAHDHPKSVATLNHYLAQKKIRDESVSEWKRNISRPVRDDRHGLAGRVYTPSSNSVSHITVPAITPDNADDLT
jgi:hypothetical protein